ncbi:outer membrane biosynthesis protein TonB [Paenibacillus sp. SORGH_AS306]|uniref:excalibur calcium-binding domain-containing protein n=1 Tax=unclassified Paenibacillus TaxID=185978 RepID=UPI0027821659|nr:MULTISPECIES: excalibur calcium-binding domain-containing protein [unclassified Paenibacillus]MDQ1233952.1 outer membrane biosynthesis protein TonB [Paenibacillus sp. SORGH_AS_0306]MDR6110997.1 outer membrane biosynthesis protein TonB [Paenibacillus sp. SORGH_AS_0338]
MKKGLKIFAWIVIPYIMIFFYWKRLNKPTRYFAVTWAVLALIIGSTGNETDTKEPTVSTPINNLKSTEVKTETVEKDTDIEVATDNEKVKPTPVITETTEPIEEVEAVSEPIVVETNIEESKKEVTDKKVEKPKKAATIKKEEVVVEEPSEPEVADAVEEEESPVTEVFYQNCSVARDAGVTPLYEDDPGYSTKLDRDRDGVACE